MICIKYSINVFFIKYHVQKCQPFLPFFPTQICPSPPSLISFLSFSTFQLSFSKNHLLVLSRNTTFSLQKLASNTTKSLKFLGIFETRNQTKVKNIHLLMNLNYFYNFLSSSSLIFKFYYLFMIEITDGFEPQEHPMCLYKP